MNHNPHKTTIELLPFYLNGTLAAEERRMVAAHLETCEACRQELQWLQTLAGEMKQEHATLAFPGSRPVEYALARISRTRRKKISVVWLFLLIRSQIPLIRKDIWLTSFLILFIGMVASYLLEMATFFYVIAPLVAVASVSSIYGRSNDPAYELVLSTPVRQSQILFSRLTLVFGYNLILTLLVTIVMIPIQEQSLSLPLIMDWLAPMTFLSMLALCLTVLFGTGNAVFTAYILWFCKFIFENPQINTYLRPLHTLFTWLWQSSSIQFLLSACLLGITLVVLKFPKIQQQNDLLT